MRYFARFCAKRLDFIGNMSQVNPGSFAPQLRRQMLEKSTDDAAANAGSKVSGKREKFVELAEKRTRNAIRAIRIIAKLGNKNAYDYSEADVKKIAAVLNREVEALKARMLATGGKDVVDFTL
jgi:ribosomal protein L7/L12